jgi:hypothetical protein
MRKTKKIPLQPLVVMRALNEPTLSGEVIRRVPECGFDSELIVIDAPLYFLVVVINEVVYSLFDRKTTNVKPFLVICSTVCSRRLEAKKVIITFC